MFTNADALPYELAGITDATANLYHPPDLATDEGAAYRRAWLDQRVRIGADPEDTNALVLGALAVRRAKAAS